jgi:hypothetical protein
MIREYEYRLEVLAAYRELERSQDTHAAYYLHLAAFIASAVGVQSR